MTYVATNIVAEPEIVYQLIASGVTRLRTYTNELKSIFSTLGTTKQNQIEYWFTSDQAEIDQGWGYVPLPERLPSVHTVLEQDNQSDIYIGNADDWDDDNDGDDSVFNFQKTVLIVIRAQNTAYSYYLYLIIKHIIKTYYLTLVETYGFKNMVIQGVPNIVQPEDGTFVFQYELRLNFLSEEKFSERNALDTITGSETTQTKYFQEMRNYPTEDPQGSGQF